jgi:predicted alpha/beta hydrolase
MVAYSMNSITLHIPAKDGYPLAAQLRQPTGESKGIIQINCGTGIPQTIYHHLADYLAENGYTTITYDYRGIGASKPTSLKGFEASMTDWAQLDMTGVLAWIIREFPNKKRILIGHSFGGQVVGLMENNHLIDQLFLIASSTGYWKDMAPPAKWIMPALWYLFIPSVTSIFGYGNARILGRGENLPKGVVLQFRKWCIDPNYFIPDFTESKIQLYFDQITIPIKAIQITDDPIANPITFHKILAYYRNAPITIERISPVSVGVNQIGHSGFFSRKFKDTLWKNLLKDLSTSNNV